MPPFLIDIFCVIDDFCKYFHQECEKNYLPSANKRRRVSRLSLSEMMTILIYFHKSDYKTFKHFYLELVLKEWKGYFPNLVCYSRFVQMMPQALMPLTLFLKGMQGQKTNHYYVDSTTLKVCHIKREKRHKVFKGFAKKRKNTMGWFFGLKLHLVVNHLGEIMSFNVTHGATDDRVPVPGLLKNLQGWLFGDRGYVGQEFVENMKKQGIDLFTRMKKNMKKKVFTPTQTFFLNKRGIIETIIGLLKNQCQIEHTRHRKLGVW
jgi:hypothetical protein